ncbi:MAG: arylesterase [Marinoscillum sp.]
MIKYIVWLIIGFQLLFSSCGDPKSSQNNEKTEDKQAASVQEVNTNLPIILFFGNSITAGYNLEVREAFPALIQERLDSLGYAYKVVNAGLSGETSAGGLNRIEWVLQTVPDIFILELGANDGLRGLDLDETKKNLKGIIEKVRKANPEVKIILAGMQVPPNLGKEYTGRFREMFKEIARESETELIPFLLKDVAGIADLNLSDGIHPTPEGHEIVAENVWPYLKPLLEEKSAL